MTEPTIIIPAAALPPRGRYLRYVLEHGHLPGVLSGAELKGRARSYGARYAEQRDRAAAIAWEYGGVASRLIIGPTRRRVRVWTLPDATPCRVVVDDTPRPALSSRGGRGVD